MLNTKPQTRIDRFYGFTNAIADLAKNRMKDDATVSSSTLLGLISEYILDLIELQQDVDLRNMLQQSVGVIGEYKLKDRNGVPKSLGQLHTEERLKWFPSPHKTLLHLPPVIKNDSVLVVMPINIGMNTNKR